MKQANFSVKFGDPTYANIPSYFKIQVELNQDKIQSHYKKYSTLLKKYRLPMVVMDLPQQFQKVQYKPIKNIIGDEMATEQLLCNGRCYNMFESKTPEQVVMLRKLEKMLKQMTTLDSFFFINIMLFDLTAKRQLLVKKEVQFAALLLQNLKIEANLGLDKDFLGLAGHLLSKVSPGFENSPLMGFLDIFSEGGVDIEFENPSILKKETRADVFSDFIEYEEPGDDEQDTLIKSMLQSQKPVTLFVHVGKLGYLKMTGQARIWAYLLCLA